MQPLAGLRVLDLTQLLAGPFCTMLLADMGADVIKVEPPAGDAQRRAMQIAGHGESPTFLAVNRNKRSIAIDLATTEGRDLFVELAGRCDVVVENFRPGTTAKLGIDDETLRSAHPGLIYASISGFGEDGPYAGWPGLDLIAQGMSGLMSITGHPGQPPAKIGVPVTDLTAGIYCALGIVTAYVGRQATGEGQRVTTSLFSAGVSLALWESTLFWSTGEVPGPIGSAHRLAAPYEALRTADGHITVGAGTDKLWERLARAIRRDELLADRRFVTNADRMRHREELVATLEATFTTRPTAEWVDLLVDAGVPAGPILDYEEVLHHPHTSANGMVVSGTHPVAGEINMLGTPFRLSATDVAAAPAPLLGEHTDEVLLELGVDADRIAGLREAGVLATRR